MNEYKMTEGVLYAVKNSQIVSRKYKLGYVGTEEVLYGLLCLPRCEACKCLAEYGVNKDNYFDQLKNSFRYDDKTDGFSAVSTLSSVSSASSCVSSFSRHA